MRRLRVGLAFALVLASVSPAVAQTVSGKVYEDRDGDGVRDAGEPGLDGVQVELFGTADPETPVDQSVDTGPDGSFSFSPDDGCYVLRPVDPAGWRLGPTRRDGFVQGTAPYVAPVGQPRFSGLDQGIDHLRSGAVRYTAMGDSIAWNFNFFCGYLDEFWYSKRLRERLACAAPAAAVTLDEEAIKGEHTDHLLIDDADNNAFETIRRQSELVTISMIGNDLLDVDVDNPNQTEINTAVTEVLDSRRNLQEALSAMISEIPAADIALNSLYDNEADDCSSTTFHRQWVPIMNQMLRDLAWGQARRVAVNEVAAEFAREDQVGGCAGFQNRICQNAFDGIHPNNAGYEIVLEKVWEAAGGVNLGPKDVLGRASIPGVDYGYLRRVRRLLPSSWELLGGATVQNPGAALDDQDGGSSAQITLSGTGREFRLGGFADWFDEIEIVKVIAGVRYRTGGTGTFGSNDYRMEASVTGEFAPPPGHDFSTTDWNYYTPIVGGGGPPDAVVLVVPNVASHREASATLTKNPVLSGGAAEYEWPAVTHQEVATTEIRVTSTPNTTPCSVDCPEVELDYAWLDLYGWEKPRPAEAEGLRVERLTDGTLEVSFDPVTGAQRYNLYFGRLATVATGGYDHGGNAPAGPLCDATTQDAGNGRLKIVVASAQQPAENAYVLVTAHADDVESPAGHRSDATEIDRSQSSCR